MTLHANDYFEKLGSWLADGILPSSESNQPTEPALGDTKRRRIEKSKQLTAILDYWLLQLEDDGFVVQRKEFGEIVIWNVIKGDFKAEIRQVWGKNAEVRFYDEDPGSQTYNDFKIQFMSVVNLIPALHNRWARDAAATMASEQSTKLIEDESRNELEAKFG